MQLREDGIVRSREERGVRGDEIGRQERQDNGVAACL